MNNLLNKVLAMTAVTVLLASCGTSPPNNYYMLSARDVGVEPESQTPRLGVGPIEIPQYLNRNGLVYNRDGNQLRIANYERWAEPLDNGVQRVLALNLATLLGTENVQSFPWNSSETPEYSVEVTVISLDVNNRQATLIAEWAIHKSKGEGILTRKISRLYGEMPGGEAVPAQIAPAYSELLYQLSEIIAATISEDIGGA